MIKDVMMVVDDKIRSEGVRCGLRRSFLWQGVGFVAVVIVLIVVVLNVPTFTHEDGEMRYPNDAIVFGVGASMMLLIGLSFVVMYMRSGLSVSDDGIEVRGVFGTRRMAWEEIVGVKWLGVVQDGQNGETVVLKTDDLKMTVHLGNYSKVDGKAIVKCIREKIDEEIQEGWETYTKSWIPFEEVVPWQPWLKLSALGMVWFYCTCGVSVFAGYFIWLEVLDRQYSNNSYCGGGYVPLWETLMFFCALYVGVIFFRLAFRHVKKLNREAKEDWLEGGGGN